MAPRVLGALVVLATLAVAAAAARNTVDAPPCVPRASAAYTARVNDALRSARDVWGEQLLAAPGGPTYARATGRLAAITFARRPKGDALTGSGVYYVPFAMPRGSAGATDVMLHVADGGAILAGRATGEGIEIEVGADGRERFGACLPRLRPARLADGWLPILLTRYEDASGSLYAQESFAARTADGRLASYVRVEVTTIRPVRVRVGSLSIPVPRGVTRAVHARWTPGRRPVAVGAEAYASARASVVSYWRDRSGVDGRVSVPERRVRDAMRALLVQGLELTWRYSIGNAYEQFSFPETLDDALVLGEYGFEAVARAILVAALPTRPTPYPNWKKGEKLLAAGAHYRRFRDRALLARLTPTLRRFLSDLERQVGANGLLPRERYSSDVPDAVYGLHAQARVWQGLREIGWAWRHAGEAALDRRARTLAARLGRGIRVAVARSQRTLPDGSLFVPMRLLDDVQPYPIVTTSRDGSYWNLVAPYALASGILPPSGTQARGILRYLDRHGARLLGLVRTRASVLYGPDAGGVRSGVNPVYGNNASRFLAALDEPDRLVLALYGHLAAGMAPGTFVAGEGTSVAPLLGVAPRTTYLPPNAAANATFLATLRLLLVREGTDSLDLAFATPRAWLAAGKRIAVSDLPTRFGPVSFAIDARAKTIGVRVDVPPRTPPRRLRLRLRLPTGQRLGNVRPARPVDERTQTIDLSGLRGTVLLEVDRRG